MHNDLRLGDRFIIGILVLFGLIGVAAGIGTIVFSLTAVNERVRNLSSDLKQSIESAQRSISSVGRNIEFIPAAADLVQSSSALIGSIPETLIPLKGSVSQVSNSLIASARTLEGVEKNTGLILPDGPFRNTAIEFRKTGEQLAILSKMLDNVQNHAARVEQSSSGLSGSLNQFANDLRSSDNVLTNVQDRLDRAQVTIDDLRLPMIATVVTASYGGLFLLLGLICLGSSQIYKKAAQRYILMGKDESETLWRVA